MQTVLHKFSKNCASFKGGACFLVKEQGSWKELSWLKVATLVTKLAERFLAQGVGKGDYVAILSNSRFEWTVIDIATHLIGAITVPIYNTLTVDQIVAIINHSSSKRVFIENRTLAKALEDVRSKMHLVEEMIIIEGNESFNIDVNEDISVLDKFNNFTKEISSNDIATCIYTSGTTGEPKGALITHANILAEVDGLANVFSFTHEDTNLLFLPLAHVIARALQFYQLFSGCKTAYAESIEMLGENIQEVKPTFMAAVPRILEKIHEGALAKVDKSSAFKKFIFNTALKIGKDVSKQIRLCKRVSFLTKIKFSIVQKFVFSELREKLGGHLKYIISGGAPLDRDIADFFYTAGILVLEGYGLTETTAAVSINRPDDYKFGTVGKPLDGVTFRIANDGEVLVRGGQVFKGYKEPASGSNDGAFQGEWFNTGDIGEFTREGFLKITGRKKELIITASGKNIAPQRVENLLKSSPYINDAIIFGDKRKYLSALLTINCEQVSAYARLKGLEFGSVQELINAKWTQELIKSEIECKNKQLARHETVKKFSIIEHDFSQAGGELTPTLKPKRQKIFDKYQSVIEGMYS